MQTPSLLMLLLLRTVRQSDCNQFQHQLTMANPMVQSIGPVNHESIYVSALIVPTVS